MLALKDFKDKDFETVSKRPAFCQKKHHENEELLEFFCKICKIAICKSYALTNHKGHAKILLEEAADERKLQVKSLMKSKREKRNGRERMYSLNLTKAVGKLKNKLLQKNKTHRRLLKR